MAGSRRLPPSSSRAARPQGAVEWPSADAAGFTASSMGFVFFHDLGHAPIDRPDLPTVGKDTDVIDESETRVFLEGAAQPVSKDADAAIEAVVLAAESRRLLRKGTATQLERGEALPWWHRHGPDIERPNDIVSPICDSDPGRFRPIVVRAEMPVERARERERVRSRKDAVPRAARGRHVRHRGRAPPHRDLRPLRLVPGRGEERVRPPAGGRHARAPPPRADRRGAQRDPAPAARRGPGDRRDCGFANARRNDAEQRIVLCREVFRLFLAACLEELAVQDTARVVGRECPPANVRTRPGAAARPAGPRLRHGPARHPSEGRPARAPAPRCRAGRPGRRERNRSRRPLAVRGGRGGGAGGPALVRRRRRDRRRSRHPGARVWPSATRQSAGSSYPLWPPEEPSSSRATSARIRASSSRGCSDAPRRPGPVPPPRAGRSRSSGRGPGRRSQHRRPARSGPCPPIGTAARGTGTFVFRNVFPADGAASRPAPLPQPPQGGPGPQLPTPPLQPQPPPQPTVVQAPPIDPQLVGSWTSRPTQAQGRPGSIQLQVPEGGRSVQTSWSPSSFVERISGQWRAGSDRPGLRPQGSDPAQNRGPRARSAHRTAPARISSTARSPAAGCRSAPTPRTIAPDPAARGPRPSGPLDRPRGGPAPAPLAEARTCA